MGEKFIEEKWNFPVSEEEKALVEKLKRMSLEERKKYFNDNMKRYDRLTYAFTNVMLLRDFIYVIDKHKDELQYPANRVNVKLGDFKSGETLGAYIILQIVSYYELTKKIKTQRNKPLPDLPNYFDILEKFRNQIVAHLDKKEKLPQVSDWFREYEKVDSIGINNILKDFENNYFRCREILKDEMS